MNLLEIKAEIVSRRNKGLDSPNLTRLADNLVAHHAKESYLQRILDDPAAIDRLMDDDGAVERLLNDIEIITIPPWGQA